ncbi:MAG: HAMP domain-containing histidine kinase [Ruminococcus sp.]|nr:HAMP domain-containing histidine kinase [Ruminococcus sp.]
MNILKKKITRLTAFILSAVLIFYCAFTFGNAFKKDSLAVNAWQNEFEYPHNSLSEEYFELNSKLWLICNMYIRNLDGKGNYTGSKYQKQFVEKHLKELGFMDEKGKLIFPESKNFSYSICNNDYVYDYGEKGLRESNDGMTAIRDDGASVYSDMFHFYSFNSSIHWYDNKNGMEYYYYNGKGYAVFDYDTSKLESYTDDCGALIYLNENGTTPIPSDFNSFNAHQDYEYPIYDEETEDYTVNSSEHWSYDVFVDENGNIGRELVYDRYYGDCFKGVIVAIRPNKDIVDKYIASEKVINDAEEEMMVCLVGLIPFFAVIAVLFIYRLIVGGYDEKKKRYVIEPLGNIWTELYIAFFVVCIAGFILSFEAFSELLDHPSENGLYQGFTEFQLVLAFASAITALILIAFECVNIIIIKLKCRRLIKTSLTGKICIFLIRKIKNTYKRIKESFTDKSIYKNSVFTRHFVIRALLWMFIEILVLCLAVVMNDEVVPFLLTPLVVFGYFFYTIKDCSELSKLGERIDRIQNGDYSKETVAKDSVIYGFNEKLNSITDGIEGVVEKQIQSERMKIDLVTNVSHDLKTPLTSIISYVDLLSLEKLTPEANDYVKILQTKTERLKEIVSDVFDLAKATSKTDVMLENLDAVVLVKQVLGDMQDRISTSRKTLITDIQPDEAQIRAEGKKMYRVLQNVIDNALKYSLDGTRIFLRVFEENGKVNIELKNTSSYEMKFTADEITERFKRGDESRTTEGSGLGLAIAKSFTEACGGQFEVKIDGDLFITNVRMEITE